MVGEGFFTRSGEFSYVTVAVLSFFFGILASTVGDAIKRKREKNRLIDLFMQDIRRNWQEVDSFSLAPVGPIFSRLRFEWKGAEDLSFRGNPEYLFEVYNLRFFEIEGVKLAQMLPLDPRKKLWDAYSVMRDAEAVRGVLNRLPHTDPDYVSYQKLFVELLNKLKSGLLALEGSLWRERSWWAKLTPGPK